MITMARTKAIRLNYIYMLYKNQDLRKAFALALFIKLNFVSSDVSHYSLNKLHKLTGLHYQTLKKRLETLRKYNLIKFNGDSLVFCKVSSKSDLRNDFVFIDDFSSVKAIEEALLAWLFVKIQQNKDFAKHTIQSVHDPKDIQEMKKARRICRRYGYGNEYVEYGLSYKGIAKRIGVSVKKAVGIVRYAISIGIVTKVRNYIQRFIQNAKMFEKFGENVNFTFLTNNNAYKILANTYTLSIPTLLV